MATTTKKACYFLEADFGDLGVTSARWYMIIAGEKHLLEERSGRDSHRELLDAMVEECKMREIYRKYSLDISTAVSDNRYTWRSKPFEMHRYELDSLAASA